MNLKYARKLARRYKVLRLFSKAQYKMIKSMKRYKMWFPKILHLAAYNISGVMNVCSHASPGRSSECIYYTGMGFMPNAIKARKAKTVFFKEQREAYLTILDREIANHVRLCERLKLKPCFRFNGTSDLPYEAFAPWIFEKWNHVQFWDYTKIPHRALNSRFANYDLTFSQSEINARDVAKVLKAGKRVAIVFEKLPSVWRGRKVLDATKHDYRFLEAPDTISGLLPLGRAVHDETGFVVRPSEMTVKQLLTAGVQITVRGKVVAHENKTTV